MLDSSNGSVEHPFSVIGGIMSIEELIPLAGIVLLTLLQLVVLINCKKILSLFMVILGIIMILLYLVGRGNSLLSPITEQATWVFVLLDIFVMPLSRVVEPHAKCRAMLPGGVAVLGIVLSVTTLVVAIITVVSLILISVH